MKDKLARELIEGLRREERQDYTIQDGRIEQLRRDHKCLLEYLGLESKRTPETTKYVKRVKK